MATEPKRGERASVYLGGAKIATLESFTYKIMSNDEAHTTDGPGVFTDGKPTLTISTNTVVVTDGATDKVTDAILSKKNLTLQVGPVDSAIHGATVRCMDADYAFDVKTGKMTGNFNFAGFTPEKS